MKLDDAQSTSEGKEQLDVMELCASLYWDERWSVRA